MTNTAAIDANSNRLEILLFHLGSSQAFGINVLKVKEIIPVPNLTQLPDSSPYICGIASLRGQTLPVIDLAQAIGQNNHQNTDEPLTGSVIIAEFNRALHGFLVRQVDHIIHREWTEISPTPTGLGTSIFTSGITNENKQLVQILDLERIIADFEESVEDGFAQISDNELTDEERKHWVLLVDDSALARSQTARALDTLKIPYIEARDGKEALAILNKHNSRDADPSDAISLVLSDIEMPEMDGYSLTQEIRQKAELANLYILLHTSLTGAINSERAQQCGADAFLTKFAPEELAREIVKGLKLTTQRNSN
ncbi:MAG: chemotaxis protein [Gammaproteobacteria bacterium]|nr:chemotaxis protein [Gammaproteobacteria bacterium]